MKQEKFNITLIRDALRCKKDGKISKASYPKAFGDKEKNNFKLGLAFLQRPCYNNHVPVRSAQHKRIWRISSAG